MTELLTIGYGGKKPTDFFNEIEQLKPCCVVDVRRDPFHAFLNVYTKPSLEKRIMNYVWIPELGNKLKTLPPEYVNEKIGFAKLEELMRLFNRVVLLCAEKDEDRCHRKWIKEKVIRDKKEICLWCFKRHRQSTKIKLRHNRFLERIRSGEIPCQIAECRTYLCTQYRDILRIGMKTLDVNCNEILAMLNRVDAFLEELNDHEEKP